MGGGGAIVPFFLITKILSRNNVKYISGLEMSVYQGIKQFEIYTGKKLSLSKVKKEFNYIF